MKCVVPGRCLRFVIFVALLGFAELQAGEMSAVLLPIADTGLYEITPTNNLGRSTGVPVGAHFGAKRSRYLLGFAPASALPAGAVVTRAELQVQVTAAGSPSWNYSVHQMLRDWVEGNQEGNNGSPAAPGETTWLARNHPAGLWTLPGGSEGADYSATPSATAALGGAGSTNAITSAELAADVQLWLDQPTLNFGWMIRAVDETVPQTARRIASRETDSGPVLIVHYLPPDEDGDGVADADDHCPGTAPGVIVNASGCSLEQLAPCDGRWKNHGQYVAAVAVEAEKFMRAGLLTVSQRAAVVRTAAQSDCGR